jgi:hypothetical protein
LQLQIRVSRFLVNFATMAWGTEFAVPGQSKRKRTIGASSEGGFVLGRGPTCAEEKIVCLQGRPRLLLDQVHHSE